MLGVHITFDTESIPLAELLVPDEVDVGPGLGDEWVRVCVGEAAEGVWAGGGEVRPTHGALHGVQGRVQPAITPIVALHFTGYSRLYDMFLIQK